MENNENQNKEEQNDEIIENENPLEKVNEVIKDLPEEKRKMIRESISLSMQGIMAVPHPMMEKVSSEHITTVLANADKDSDRAFKLDIIGKVIGSLVFVFILIAVVVLIYVFRNHMNDISELLKALIYAGSGLLGGYGLGYYKGREE